MSKKPVAANSDQTAYPWRFKKGNKLAFKPGQSGNPSGRPKRDVSAIVAQAVFECNEEGIYKAMVKAIKTGGPSAMRKAKVFEILAARGFGKLTQRLERHLQRHVPERTPWGNRGGTQTQVAPGDHEA